MALEVVNDGYRPSEYEDDDYNGNFASRKMEVLNNFTGEIKKKRKRKRKRGNCDSQENSEDPLVVFGRDIMLMILNHLDARSVALSLLVSRSWHGVASSDAIWSKKNQETYIKILKYTRKH
ncbi:unnamed protein product [Lactuca saligna]|uniref:F-box domain-containing protein n=1 Tax=Lactuca saligna TaxID=75948 RepID=A0AA35V698_LACSI|nr:unnamed protein product [Lactuca saligna]